VTQDLDLINSNLLICRGLSSKSENDPVNLLKHAAAAAALASNSFGKSTTPPTSMATSISPPTSAAAASSALLGALAGAASGGQPNDSDLVTTLLKSNPALLLNPALLSLNPSMYAVQLAQLQLLAQQLQPGQASSANSASLEAIRRLTGQSESSDLSSNPLAQVRKRKHDDSEDAFAAQQAALAGVLNLSAGKSSPRLTESPLDLSGSKKLESPGGKIPKLGDDKMSPPPAWPFLHPLLATGTITPEALTRLQMGIPSSVASSSPSPSSLDMKNPLERMSEIAKGSSSNAQNSPGGLKGAAPGSRPSAWQSQWLNRGPESNKDIFKCVWCKESFSSLQLLTTHMKETKHFGASIPPSPTLPPTCTQGPTTPTGGLGRPPIPSPSLRSPQHSGGSMSNSNASSTASNSSKARDILKEQLPMPRKLVRGQDVWLGRGEQQTKDILKCMWCGESFRSLDLMTKHMQETKHYTKVISQEQLMSWRSPETSTSSQNHVNAVLTCKVCEQAFSTLKELSDHMVKNNHYKQDESSPAAAAQPAPPASSNTGQQQRSRAGSLSPRQVQPSMPPSTPVGNSQAPTKEKRKKSLPVRKLLELERAQQELSGQVKPSDPAGRIACEKCGDKILMHLFVDHIRQCVGPSLLKSTTPDLSRLLAASAASIASSVASMPTFTSTRTPSVSPPSLFSVKKSSPLSSPSQASPTTVMASGGSKMDDEPKSILGSLEKMVQNNFGAKKKMPDSHLSILQRLGIDEGVDYNKPLIDPMAMFRSPSQMAAAVAAAGGLSGFLPGGPPFSSAASTTTRSNSSECSSPDRFRASGERPSSTKSAASAKSPVPDEVPLAASVIKKPLPVPEKKEEEDKSVGEDEEDESKGVDDSKSDDNEEAMSSPPPLARRRTRSSSRKTDDDEKCEQENSPKSPIISAKDLDKEEEAEDKAHEAPPAAKEAKKKSHPLAALQMLCDKTEKKSSTGNGSSMGGNKTGPATSFGPTTDPGAILAFSWACNQAVVNDSLLKCPFCDTPFISKGAYRHHLSKMHFVKEGGGNMVVGPGNSAVVTSSGSSGASADSVNKTSASKGSPAGGANADGSSSNKEENAQSKFQKYSQLAKQLSCGSSQP
jgi:teashirt-like protein